MNNRQVFRWEKHCFWTVSVSKRSIFLYIM